MKKSPFPLWQVGLVLIAAACLVSMTRPLVNRSPRNGQRASCQSNLKQIALAIRQYIQDSDEKFPPVKSGNRGWAETLQPYLKSQQIFQCPSESSGNAVGTTDYFYNAHLVGFHVSQLPLGADTIMNGDGRPDSPPSASLSEFPVAWASDSKSPLFRHFDGANYSYADGHVKWGNNANLRDAPDRVTFFNYNFAPWLYP